MSEEPPGGRPRARGRAPSSQQRERGDRSDLLAPTLRSGRARCTHRDRQSVTRPASSRQSARIARAAVAPRHLRVACVPSDHLPSASRTGSLRDSQPLEFARLARDLVGGQVKHRQRCDFAAHASPGVTNRARSAARVSRASRGRANRSRSVRRRRRDAGEAHRFNHWGRGRQARSAQGSFVVVIIAKRTGWSTSGAEEPAEPRVAQFSHHPFEANRELVKWMILIRGLTEGHSRRLRGGV